MLKGRFQLKGGLHTLLIAAVLSLGVALAALMVMLGSQRLRERCAK